jgi:hypothetical protein
MRHQLRNRHAFISTSRDRRGEHGQILLLILVALTRDNRLHREYEHQAGHRDDCELDRGRTTPRYESLIDSPQHDYWFTLIVTAPVSVIVPGRPG